MTWAAADSSGDGEEPLAVLTVTGSAYTVLNRDDYGAATARLPPTTTRHEIAGLNHAQFASYRGQRGDAPAPLSYDDAHRRLADVLVPWLGNHSVPVSSGAPSGDVPMYAFRRAATRPHRR